MYLEVNFDGLVGPTHNYAGLSYGNLASLKHKKRLSRPKDAALQGLEKMKRLSDLGVRQAVLPPHERPSITVLNKLGFPGIEDAPIEILAQCSSASAMWAANSATMAPSVDTQDEKVHITPANLHDQFHRSLEARFTKTILDTLFCDQDLFEVHSPLPSHSVFSDEGSANHIRLAKGHGGKGVHLFFWGNQKLVKKFPARQTLHASQALARLHKLDEKRTLFLCQNPVVIDQGVFHNDVISTGNEDHFLYHEEAFLNLEETLDHLRREDQVLLPVNKDEISVETAVSTYLFNSQIVSIGEEMVFLAPKECEDNPAVKAFLENLTASNENRISGLLFTNIRESMQNGGGPACLRFKMVLSEKEIASIKQNLFLDDVLYRSLKKWIEKHYRDELAPEELQDPALYQESCDALEELTHLLRLGPVYAFQK